MVPVPPFRHVPPQVQRYERLTLERSQAAEMSEIIQRWQAPHPCEIHKR